MSDPQGLVFDSTAGDYERGRTGWPPSLCDGVDGERVLDLAAGTGKLTRELVRRFTAVVAVEPLPGMRALGKQLVPDAEWLAGRAEAIPLPDASVDAVFVAEAFHWFDSRQAIAEIARVLRPGGAVLIAFTVWDSEFEPPLPHEAIEAFTRVSERTGTTGAPRWQSEAWKQGFESVPFTQLAQRDTHSSTPRIATASSRTRSR